MTSPCPSKAMRTHHGKWSLGSPEAQRFVQQVEAWERTGDRLPTHCITINLLKDGPLPNFDGTACGRRERYFSDLRRLFNKHVGKDGRPVPWRHVWVMECGEQPSYFPHVHLLLWLPKDAAFRRRLWAYLARRFRVPSQPGKKPWHVLNQKGKRHAVCVRLITGQTRNSRTGRSGLHGLTDYLVKEIDRNAFQPGRKAQLGDLVGASTEIVEIHRAAGFSRPRLRLQTIPLVQATTAVQVPA
jgi:hypothetical protein